MTAPRDACEPRAQPAPGRSVFAVVIGPSASGKTTVGRLLAERLGWPFVDADDLHPQGNRERMRRGQPLDDEHRRPWLDAVHAELRRFAASGQSAVVSCSALKRRYRARIRGDLDGVRFFHLVAPRATLAERITRREGHFFPPSLLDSQLAIVERGDDAMEVDGTKAPEEIVTAIREALRR